MFSVLKTILLMFMILFSVACSDSKPDKLLQSFSNDLNNTTIPKDISIQINVFANYSDGTKVDITDTLLWSSSDDSLATVSSGLVTPQGVIGSVIISYETNEKSNDGSAIHSDSITLNILNLILQKIRLSKSAIILSVGASQNIDAIGTYDDNSTHTITDDCNWSSSDTNITTVDKGLVSGISEGNATIIARDGNITSENSLDVEVVKINYVSLSIYSKKTEFNVEQIIELEARATTDMNETVILDNSSVDWISDDTVSVSIDSATGIATAEAKGSAIITAKINLDASVTDTIELTVSKDEYLRFYRDGEEFEFPYVATSEYDTTLPDTLSEFSIRAIGRDFKISDLNVTDFSGNIIDSSKAWFENLVDAEIISEDNNRTFELKHDKSSNELHYYFKIDDTFSSEFSQKYRVRD